VDRIRGLFEAAVKAGDLDAGDRTGIVEKLNGVNAPMGRPAGDMPAERFGAGMDRAGGAKAGAELKSEAAAAGQPAENKAQDRLDLFLKDAEKRDGATRSKEQLEDLMRRGAMSGDLNGTFFDDSRKKLAAIRQLYRRVPPTQEWAENNYYHLRIQ